MTLTSTCFVLSGLAVATLGAAACGALPPDAPVPRNVTTIRLSHPVCPDPQTGENTPLGGAVPVGLTCTMTADVLDEWGIPMLQPELFWSSSDVRILSASGSGRTASIRGRITGTATVTASNRRGDVTASAGLSVVTRR